MPRNQWVGLEENGRVDSEHGKVMHPSTDRETGGTLGIDICLRHIYTLEARMARWEGETGSRRQLLGTSVEVGS